MSSRATVMSSAQPMDTAAMAGDVAHDGAGGVDQLLGQPPVGHDDDPDHDCLRSRWRTFTVYPFSDSRSAMALAIMTERCLPPVQPMPMVR